MQQLQLRKTLSASHILALLPLWRMQRLQLLQLPTFYVRVTMMSNHVYTLTFWFVHGSLRLLLLR